MQVLGLTLSTTSDGLDLMDGNAALAINGQPVRAIAEERLSRCKYDGGLRRAIAYCTERIGTLDQVVVSSCCDEVPTAAHAQEVLAREGFDIGVNRITVCTSHHASHAAAAFFPSPFAKALVLVADNEGNILGKRNQPLYFDNPLEKTSLYLAKDGRLELFRQFHSGAGELGIGNAYAYFTEYLGFANYQAAGKVMGLAAYGDRSFLRGCRLFEAGPAGARCQLEALQNKQLAVRRFLARHGQIDVGYFGSESTEVPGTEQKNLAAYIQREVEAELLSIVRDAIVDTGITDVCLGGGVALNCVANGRILTETGATGLYVSPAPGDSGQALGNVLWLASQDPGGPQARVALTPYLGRSYASSAYRQALEPHSRDLEVEEVHDSPAAAAADLVLHRIVFWFQGASEIGPRALGNRSILANPCSSEIKDILNERVKHREHYRPFAPAVLQEHAEHYFGVKDSPHMHLAVQSRGDLKRTAPGVVHVDGSARLQTVSEDLNPLFYALIANFYRATGVPMVINTSFNVRGEPIVESPADAVRCFVETEGDVLYLGSLRVTKRSSKQ